ncbi:MAG: sigma-70 domain-containing protein [Suilimivivens sp.]
MEASQEVLFAKTLEQVRKQAKEQGNCIEREQVEQAFASLSLSKEQLDLVFDYLEKHKIGIGEPVDPDEYLSEEEVNYLEEYKKELALLEKVSEGEKEAITLSAMAGEAQAQKKLINIYLPQVVEIAKLYSGQGVFLEDLIGEGNVALTIGVTMLGCLEHAKEAEGMLGKMIMDAMEDYINENMAEEDKDKKVLSKVKKVARKAKELSEELRRKVTVEELSAETGMSENAIREAMQLSGYTIEEIENPS